MTAHQPRRALSEDEIPDRIAPKARQQPLLNPLCRRAHQPLAPVQAVIT